MFRRHFTRHRIRRSLLNYAALLLLLCCVSCTIPGQPYANVSPPTATRGTQYIAINWSGTNTAHFTFSGGQNATYTLRSDQLTSKLRHGHREFTILLKSQQMSLFIVFYGYNGPGTYTLKDGLNGGDVHVGLQNDTTSWDLLMKPTDSCTLTIESDMPVEASGVSVSVDHMLGAFFCPELLSSSPIHPQRPIKLSNGTFDVDILVES